MSMDAAQRSPHHSTPLTPEEQVRAAREIIRLEAVALWKLSDRMSESFCRAVSIIHACHGSLIVTGMGKAGIIGQKIAATMASVGTRAHFLHPADAFHGDLGRIHGEDVVLMLTQSGETREVVQLLPSIRDFGAPLIAVTASQSSTVGQAAAEVLELGQLEEACSLGLAPSTSTTAMLALGDALALVLSRMRGFRAEDFARFHPGGSLGRRLSKVDDHLRPLSQCRLAVDSQTVREVVVACGKPGRRTGAIMLTDDQGRLTGLFTDSDLARIFERREEHALDAPIREVMAHEPATVTTGTPLQNAIELLAEKKISELPIVDAQARPVGLIDVTDVVGFDDGDLDENSTVQRPTTAVQPAVRIFPRDG